jgi:cholesterol transport system auxiliary component
MLTRPLAGLLLAAALSGCSALGALDRASAALDVYELRAPAAFPAARSAQSIDFVVEPPSASASVATDRILVRPTPSQVQYLPDARWAEPAPVMLQSALVEGFERAGAFRYTGRRPLAISGDVALVSNLTDFQVEIDPATDASAVRITLVARLVRESDATVGARRTFTALVPTPDTSTPALMAGFEQATDAVLVDVARWVYGARGIAPAS